MDQIDHLVNGHHDQSEPERHVPNVEIEIRKRIAGLTHQVHRLQRNLQGLEPEYVTTTVLDLWMMWLRFSIASSLRKKLPMPNENRDLAVDVAAVVDDRNHVPARTQKRSLIREIRMLIAT